MIRVSADKLQYGLKDIKITMIAYNLFKLEDTESWDLVGWIELSEDLNSYIISINRRFNPNKYKILAELGLLAHRLQYTEVHKYKYD
jgi:hypothetical protein